MAEESYTYCKVSYPFQPYSTLKLKSAEGGGISVISGIIFVRLKLSRRKGAEAQQSQEL